MDIQLARTIIANRDGFFLETEKKEAMEFIKKNGNVKQKSSAEELSQLSQQKRMRDIT